VDAFAAATIDTRRLALVPLREADADALAPVLADERLYEFIGEPPRSVAASRERYGALAAGSPDPAEIWLNWVVRRRSDRRAVGTVQATIVTGGARRAAFVAWMIGFDYQGQGYASEAGRGLVDWLLERGCASVEAHIHPDHGASALVALRAGLQATDEYDADGERIWRVRASAD
jgi:RimJ/RimL family protein N-acetyltransferase